MNVASERVSHPLSVTSESLQVLAQWLKAMERVPPVLRILVG